MGSHVWTMSWGVRAASRPITTTMPFWRSALSTRAGSLVYAPSMDLPSIRPTKAFGVRKAAGGRRATPRAVAETPRPRESAQGDDAASPLRSGHLGLHHRLRHHGGVAGGLLHQDAVGRAPCPRVLQALALEERRDHAGDEGVAAAGPVGDLHVAPHHRLVQ